jgi:ADP-heptose:LPS heptosyltransferase
MRIFDANKITLEKLFLLGIDQMAKVTSYYSEQTVEVNRNKILINVNASDFLLARRYPIKLFVETIKMLSSRNSKLEFYLTGSAHEFDYVQTVVTQLNGLPVYNKSGQWSLSELIDELATCFCFITCDSGPVHLATYLGVTTIALWGPTQPKHFGYDRINHLHSLSLQLECSPCFRHPTSEPAVACEGRIDCLNNLSPALIVARFSSLSAESSAHRFVNFPLERLLSQTSNMELV